MWVLILKLSKSFHNESVLFFEFIEVSFQLPCRGYVFRSRLKHPWGLVTPDDLILNNDEWSYLIKKAALLYFCVKVAPMVLGT